MLDLTQLKLIERNCFLAVLKFLIVSDQSSLALDDIANNQFPDVPKAFMRMALDVLVEKQLLASQLGRFGDITGWELHPNIYADAYELFQADFSLDNKITSASDRFVPLDHNSRPYKEADGALEELNKAVIGDNQIFATPEDRAAVLSEIKSLREILNNAVVRVSAVWTATRDSGVLGWLAKEATSGVIRTLATKAVEALIALIG